MAIKLQRPGFSYMAVARGEILGQDGERWMQEIQLGELIKRGALDAWIWVRLYRTAFVESFYGGAD